MTTSTPIYGMCKLFCEASVESDLAKRIMLSVIPSVQSESEKYYTGGFDYKALRAAVYGAKALIRYGAKAAAHEAAYATTPLEASGEDDRKLTFKKIAIKQAIQNKNYELAIKLCIEIFSHSEFFATDYGGEAWKNIGIVLLDITVKDKELEAARKEAADPNKQPQIDHLSNEIAIMKELVVLMNHFDGLAHNTADVMYNIVEEEMKDLNYENTETKFDSLEQDPYEYDPDKTPEENKILETKYNKRVEDFKYPRKYMARIQDLMDAKELENPFDVYKQVKHIIEEGQNRSTFNDYSRRIKEHPKYNEPSVDIQQAYKFIRLKKNFIPFRIAFDKSLNEMLEAHNNYIQPNGKAFFNKLNYHNGMRWAALEIRELSKNVITHLMEIFTVAEQNNPKISAILTQSNNIVNLTVFFQDTLEKAKKTEREIQNGGSPLPGSIGTVDITNEVHKLRRAVLDLENLIANV